ncbi:cation:proton antiporter [Paludibacterium yongneupense]|uniref:cation:proton antiporter n=1 Tax=Paludibacterium yongneupense TaxID=400061 RepID=UPI0003FBF301|nr:sodium:proton antiporter [Paludibacterium yongneupense]
MIFATWCLIVGGLLTLMALSGTALQRLPLSTPMLYLAVGYALGPGGWGLLTPDPFLYSHALEKAAEIAVLISLFAVGLKLGLPLRDRHWHLPLRLAVISMALSILLVAVAGTLGLGLPLGTAALLGAILAPTDPVLASDVQVLQASDRDRLRFSLTGEGGLNDGVAFPFVMLGLGLIGQHELGAFGWRWLAIDVAWAICGGLFIGGAMGALVGRIVVYLRSRHQESVGYDEFLALGLIGLSYGLALFSHCYGFLAVFAAGLALQRVREQPGNKAAPSDRQQASGFQNKQAQEAFATHSAHASAYMMKEVLGFNERMERVAEVGIVLIVGAMLAYIDFPLRCTLFALFFLLLVRPLSVWGGLAGANISRDQRALISWFGIRGIGSIYYLLYSINHGLSPGPGKEIASLTLGIVAISIVLHGISVTPLMNLYSRRKGRRAIRRQA